MAVHERRALLPTITVWAFATEVATMPADDFYGAIKEPYGAFSHESVTRGRSPEVSSTAFRTHPPNLQPVPLMDRGFAVMSPLARHRMPRIRFLFIGPHVCSTLPSDPASRRRRCASLSLHLHQVVKGLSPPSCRTCSAHAREAPSTGAPEDKLLCYRRAGRSLLLSPPFFFAAQRGAVACLER